jgi:nucleotide-binding universal stress UspA family protein
VLHVPLDVIPYAPMTPLYSTPSLREIGANILKDALDRCLEFAPDLYVEGTLCTGPRVHGIVDESADASCVVVGTREWRAYRVFGGSTSAGVAARAACPVIAVPPTWTGKESAAHVVVGVDAHAGPAAALVEAFEEARRRRAELTIVHAWTAPHPYEPALGDWDDEAWRKTTVSALTELTAAIRAEYADVKANQVARSSAPESALTEIAATSDLLVLGRHHSALPLAHRLGSLAHRALQAGTSPVEIVPVAVD